MPLPYQQQQQEMLLHENKIPGTLLLRTLYSQPLLAERETPLGAHLTRTPLSLQSRPRVPLEVACLVVHRKWKRMYSQRVSLFLQKKHLEACQVDWLVGCADNGSFQPECLVVHLVLLAVVRMDAVLLPMET